MSTSSKENAAEIFEDIKNNLTRGVKDRKHTFHTPVFSNIAVSYTHLTLPTIAGV